MLDEVLLLFDQALSGRESAARARMTEALAERARGGENRQALLDDILKIVLDPGVSDGQVGARLRGDIGHERMRAAWEARRARLPRDHGHLAMMDASMAYLRQFVPDVALLPRVPIASVLVEVDARTGFTDHLVHAGGKVTRPPELKRNLLYVIIAEATNMGLGAMAESCGVPYDVLAWTAEWYFSAETLEAANTAIVNYHHRLPMTQAFGTGTLSSSDGQRFPVKGKSLTARHLSRYFARGQGISTYTHVSDQRGLGSVAYSSSGWLTAGLPVTTGFGGVVRIFGRAGWT